MVSINHVQISRHKHDLDRFSEAFVYANLIFMIFSNSVSSHQCCRVFMCGNTLFSTSISLVAQPLVLWFVTRRRTHRLLTNLHEEIIFALPSHTIRLITSNPAEIMYFLKKNKIYILEKLAGGI